jgi:hypothetical protein
MNKKVLIIKNNKTILKEAEFSFDEILGVTGIKQTAKSLNQFAKMITATAKLVLQLVLSFRSTSFKKIIQNMKQANNDYDVRTRKAMRDISSNIKELGSGSRISQVFALTVPSVGLTNYLRTEVDNEGGLYYYLKSKDQNLYIGDLFADAYDAFDKITDDIVEGSSDKEKDLALDPKREAERQTKEAKQKFIAETERQYGPKAASIYKDLFDNKNTPETQAVIKILEDEKLDSGSRASALHNYLKGLDESIIKTITITEAKGKKIKDYAPMFLYEIIKDSTALSDMVTKKTNVDVNVEENLKYDIQKYEDILSTFSFELLIFLCINVMIDGKDNYEKPLQIIKNNYINIITNASLKKELESSCNKVVQNLKSSDQKEVLQVFMAVLKEITEKKLSSSSFQEYYKTLSENSNSKDKDFVKLKDACEDVIKKVNSFNIEKVESIIKQNIDKKES